MRRDHVLQFVLEAAHTPDFEGVTAQAVADALSIWRNDAAVELNKLVAEGKLRRVGKKNVRFFPSSEETADIRPEPAVQEEPPQAEEETGQYRAFSGLVGADGSLKYQLRVAMAAVAYPPNGLNMLITGSTGSGKSHFARTIWEYAKETKALCGAHAPIPFVEFNCAEYADNPQLLLSHLFGYKKGAFTGALEDKPGLVEQANGGILFLDEIHGLSSTGQEMFFSLLDTGVFRRVGDNTPRTSRFMLIGATTKPLTDLLETFLRRMPVLISMPTLSDRPMKERLELVEHFYAEEAAHIGRTLRIQKGALNSILDYSLHSNLGVLKNLVQLSCAKAFLRENVAGNRTGEIAVTFSDLSFQTYNVSAETEKYAHGDLIGIYAGNNVTCDGVCNALRAANMKEGVVSIGVDSDDVEIAALRDGFLSAIIVQDAFTQGYKCMENAILTLVNGQNPETSKQVNCPPVVVNMENIDSEEIQFMMSPYVK